MLLLTKFNALDRNQWSECFIQHNLQQNIIDLTRFRNSDPSTCRAYILKALTYIFTLSSTPSLQYSHEGPGTSVTVDSQQAVKTEQKQ